VQLLLDVESSCEALQAALSTEVEIYSQGCKELWSLNCAQLMEFDAILAAKDEEIINSLETPPLRLCIQARQFSLHQEQHTIVREKPCQLILTQVMTPYYKLRIGFQAYSGQLTGTYGLKRNSAYS